MKTTAERRSGEGVLDGKKSMRQYRMEYLKIMESLTDAEFGRLMRWLLGYSSGQKSAPLSGNERVLKSLVQMREDQFQAGFAETDERRKKAAAKAAEIRWNNKNAKACEGMPNGCEGMRSGAFRCQKTKPKTSTNSPC